MIIAYEGTPGSGKTYDAVRKITDNLKLKRRVVTNIDGMDDPLCRQALQDHTGLDDQEFSDLFHFIKNTEVINFWSLPCCTPGSLIIIDEAHKFFNSRAWQRRENQEFSDWCSTHRHLGFDLVLVTQKLTKIDSQAVSNVEWTYRYKKINMLGSLIKKGYTIKSFCGDDTTDPIANQVRYYDSKVFRCYQSYATTDVKELGVQKHANILRHPIFYAIPVVLVLFIFLFSRSGFTTGDWFGINKIQNRMEKVKPAVKVIPPEPKIDNSLQIKTQGQSQPAAGPLGADAAVQPVEPVKPEKKLIAIVDGKKIYRCGGKLCTEDEN